jgi:hypothetical protein
MVRKITEMVEGFHFVICITSLNKVNNGKGDDGILIEKYACR